MLYRPTLYFLFIFGVTSCISLKSPTNTKNFAGTVKTCDTDSTAITSASSIIICNNKKVNSNCENKPKFGDNLVDLEDDWPIVLFLKFKDKKYWYMFDPQPADPSKPLERIGFRTQGGKLSYDRQKKTITLTSDDFIWTKTYSFVYNETTKTFTLFELKNGL